ncbi:MAG: M48 family metallopeptidase [Rhodocyclaceae bacterium]|nr:M48 family metallopeptidase [Rhodocyclaceae bacterium]
MKRSLPLIALLAVLAACATVRTTQPGVVGVDREQTMIASAAAVNRQAGDAYRQTLQQAQKQGKLNRDPAQVARVRAIADRLIAATRSFRADAPAWQWEVNVLTAKDVNAWCMPGGKIAVYTGLLEKIRPTDDELAAVIGHEIAHALREHGREKAGQAMGVGMAAAIGGALVGSRYGIDPSLGENVLGTVGDLAFMRPNSREMEQEADRIGVELAARAGYDPYAAIGLWEKMRQVSDGGPPQWLSTHPSHATRIGDLKTSADRVAPLYRPGTPRR